MKAKKPLLRSSKRVKVKFSEFRLAVQSRFSQQLGYQLKSNQIRKRKLNNPGEDGSVRSPESFNIDTISSPPRTEMKWDLTYMSGALHS